MPPVPSRILKKKIKTLMSEKEDLSKLSSTEAKRKILQYNLIEDFLKGRIAEKKSKKNKKKKEDTTSESSSSDSSDSSSDSDSSVVKPKKKSHRHPHQKSRRKNFARS